jgi:hypothetical protein
MEAGRIGDGNGDGRRVRLWQSDGSTTEGTGVTTDTGVKEGEQMRWKSSGTEEWAVVWKPRAEGARGKVLGALPRNPARGTPPETPARFPCHPIFQNGPRRQGFATPRSTRAPLTAPGRSESPPVKRESGQMQTGGCTRPPVGRLSAIGNRGLKKKHLTGAGLLMEAATVRERMRNYL